MERTTPTALGDTECRKQPPPLPEGAWEQWGMDAVYFMSPVRGFSRGEDGDCEGLGVYAINPTDASIYHIAYFGYGPDSQLYNASCAVLGSRVYIASYDRMWFCDVGGGGGPVAEWNKARKFNGSQMCNPQLFTLKGSLYAICLIPKSDHDIYHMFQVHFNKGWWLSLDDPPTLCTTLAESETLCGHCLLAISCIGDCKVILHVSTKHFENDGCICKQHFLCYEPEDEFEGKWTRIKIDCMDYAVQLNFDNDQYTPPCRSHLLSGDPLLLPLPSGKLRAFDLSGFPELHLQDVVLNLQDLDDKLPINIRSLLLLHVCGTRYCAIAFSEPQTKQQLVDALRELAISPSEPAADLFVISFDLVIDKEESSIHVHDTFPYINAVISAQVVSFVHHRYVFQLPLPLQSGWMHSAGTRPL